MIQLLIGGVDYSNLLKSYNRHISICELECNAVLDMYPGSPQFDPYQEVLIYTSGSLHFTGYVSQTTVRRSQGNWTYQILCEHKAYKRLRDYWGNINTGVDESAASFFNRLGLTIGTTIHVAVDDGTELPNNWAWTNANFISVFEDALTFASSQPIPLDDGSISIEKLLLSKQVYVDSEGVISRCERTLDDIYFRTDTAFITTREVILASGSSPFGYRRVAIVASPMVHDFGTGYYLGLALLDEYNRLQSSHNVTMVGEYHLRVGQSLRVKDKFDNFEEYGIITSTDEKENVQGGRVNEVVTNQRCPRIFGFDYAAFDVYEHIHFAVGTSHAVVFGDEGYANNDSARVWVTPDLYPAISSSGSNFKDVGTSVEWYDCSAGLTGDFDATYVCFGSDCGGAPNFKKPAIVRDYWSEEARGAWCLTTTGLHYSSRILPPSGQSSGSWDYTPWTKVYGGTYGSGFSLYVETKANDSTGIFCAERRYVVSPAAWSVDIRQIDRSGGEEILLTYPIDSAYNVYTPFMGNFTKPYSTNPQYLSYGGYKYSLPEDSLSFVNKASGSEENVTDTALMLWGPSETDTAGNLILFPGVNTTYSNNVYETPSGLAIKSSYPDSLQAIQDIGYDAKHERLYVLARTPDTLIDVVLRSDDNGVTWAKKATTTSGAYIPGRNGVFTSRILGYKILPYITTYCVQALAWQRTSGSWSVMVSGNDGLTFNADQAAFEDQIFCMMDMQTG